MKCVASKIMERVTVQQMSVQYLIKHNVSHIVVGLVVWRSG